MVGLAGGSEVWACESVGYREGVSELQWLQVRGERLENGLFGEYLETGEVLFRVNGGIGWI